VKNIHMLRILIAAIRNTNKSFFMCQSELPTWTNAFAHNLEQLLDGKVQL
jgi:hypothetical protein